MPRKAAAKKPTPRKRVLFDSADAIDREMNEIKKLVDKMGDELRLHLRLSLKKKATA